MSEKFGKVGIVDGLTHDITVEVIPMKEEAIRNILQDALGEGRAYDCTRAFIKMRVFGQVIRRDFDVWHATTVMPDDLVTASYKDEPTFYGRLVITHLVDGEIRPLSDEDIMLIRENIVPRISADRSKVTYPLGIHP